MRTFKQCLLARSPENNFSEYDIAWIEEKGAKKGARVELKDTGEFWDVLTVWKKTLTENELKQQQSNARKGFASLKD